jgi:hypothetical protein
LSKRSSDTGEMLILNGLPRRLPKEANATFHKIKAFHNLFDQGLNKPQIYLDRISLNLYIALFPKNLRLKIEE